MLSSARFACLGMATGCGASFWAWAIRTHCLTRVARGLHFPLPHFQLPPPLVHGMHPAADWSTCLPMVHGPSKPIFLVRAAHRLLQQKKAYFCLTTQPLYKGFHTQCGPLRAGMRTGPKQRHAGSTETFSKFLAMSKRHNSLPSEHTTLYPLAAAAMEGNPVPAPNSKTCTRAASWAPTPGSRGCKGPNTYSARLFAARSHNNCPVRSPSCPQKSSWLQHGLSPFHNP